MPRRGRVHLSGAGSGANESAVYGSFFEEASEMADLARPRIAVVLWAASRHDGSQWHQLYIERFEKLGDWNVTVVQLTPTRPLSATDLANIDGLVIGGGPTPDYHRAVVPLAPEIDRLVNTGVPYCGISAGAMIAGEHALIGGWMVDGVPVAPEQSAERMNELSIQPGLGLVTGPIDTLIVQYGHLGRVVAMVETGRTQRAVGVDEDTALIVDGNSEKVVGHGRVWIAERTDGSEVVVSSLQAAPTDGHVPSYRAI